MAWSSRTMVIAFRGTAATANMWSDAKVAALVLPESGFQCVLTDPHRLSDQK